MKTYTIKHYWKNKEYSTWESDKDVDKELLSYLKNNYYRFIEKQYETLDYENYIISFEYDNNTDSFGRPITNIIFHIKEKISISRLITLFIALAIVISIILFFILDANEQKQDTFIENSLIKNEVGQVDKSKIPILNKNVYEM